MADDPFRTELDAVFGDLKASLLFLTRLPGRLLDTTGAEKPDFTRAARVFPVIGVLVGAIGGIVLLVTRDLGQSPLMAAALAVLTTFLITGGLHEDGLADTADGFGGGATPGQKLDIMDDSRVGTYGVAALIFSIGLRVLALSAIAVLGSWRGALALVAAEAVSRAAMVYLWHALPAARPGLSTEAGAPSRQAVLIGVAIAAVVVVVAVIPFAGFWAAVVGSLLAAVAASGTMLLARDQIGGRTGDVIGACQQAAAVAFLIGVAFF